MKAIKRWEKEMMGKRLPMGCGKGMCGLNQPREKVWFLINSVT